MISTEADTIADEHELVPVKAFWCPIVDESTQESRLQNLLYGQKVLCLYSEGDKLRTNTLSLLGKRH